MIERLIYTILTSGIEQLTDDPLRIDQLFTDEHGLSDDEAAKIRALFEAKPPNVIHGYARTNSDFPLFSITLGDESQSETFLSYEGDQIRTMGDADYGADERAFLFDETFNILIYAEHPDVALYYYQLAKYMLVANIELFTDCAFYNVRLSGSDMAPDRQWVPAGLFLRRLTIQGTQEYTQVDPSSKLGRAFKIGGVHVDLSGAAGEDVGGVKTLVTPIDPTELEDG